ncbi:MAG TPA: hypothetical protein G4O11_07135 [Anaerolineae bacterium]|nr:hypothetical protein [Anaerolineae bacterium]
MDAIKEFIQRKWTLVGIALLGGIILGVVYAWVISPVKWVDGEPAQLRRDLQVDYLRMVIDSYAVNLDPTLAQDRYESLGEARGEILVEVGKDPGEVSPSEIQKFQALVAVESPIEEPPEPAEEAAGFTASKILLPVLIVTLALGVLLAGALFVRRRMEVEPEGVYTEPVFEMAEGDVAPREVEIAEQPLANFRTTYTLGDDLYDDSFSIESATGDFLGECGVGIGEVIGVEEPKKVAAFEVWLFDKNDIQTVTKVLMSRYAFDDEESHTRLAAKGDPVLAESGVVVSLETASLKIDVRIVDMSYGEAPLPEESFFDRLTVELVAWQTAS